LIYIAFGAALGQHTGLSCIVKWSCDEGCVPLSSSSHSPRREAIFVA